MKIYFQNKASLISEYFMASLASLPDTGVPPHPHPAGSAMH
jgi:hypothetical protein